MNRAQVRDERNPYLRLYLTPDNSRSVISLTESEWAVIEGRVDPTIVGASPQTPGTITPQSFVCYLLPFVCRCSSLP